MSSPSFVYPCHMLTALVFASLAACGGAGDPPPQSPLATPAFPPSYPVVMPRQAAAMETSVASPTNATSATMDANAVSDVDVPGAITRVILENSGTTDQGGAPISFGQVFAVGDLAFGSSLVGQFPDGSSTRLQLDVKARHENGTVRHAIISARVPTLLPGQRVSMALLKGPAAPPLGSTAPTKLLARGFTASVAIKRNGQTYTASADALLRNGKYRSWMNGPLTNEWLMSAALVNASGVAHPHLTARFAVRAAPEENRARVDITLENNWAYEPAPQNFTYDTEIRVGGAVAYHKPALTHYHHARWRKVLWWGAEPTIHIRHDTKYLINTKALPNYDTGVVVSEMALQALKTNFSGPRTEPMAPGLAVAYMPATGGRADIGLLPGWAASYLLSMDKRAKDAMLGTADLAGSWSMHFRNRLTDRPVSVHDFPYMTIAGNHGDTLNRATGRYEAFPACASANGCDNPNTHDAAHQPGFAYLPYLVTGDFYYLEELQFWAMWNSFYSNPGYRDAGSGLVKSDQVRGQAWSLRNLGQAAYITPDSDVLKAQLRYIVDANLAWYHSQYSNNPLANTLGVLSHGYAVVYDGSTGLAPWMDDFFTSAVGHLAELGFSAAAPLLEWKVRFPIMRMNGKGACWITGAIYALKVRDTPTAPLYPSMEQAWKASHTATFAQLPCAGPEMAASLKLKVGEMTGFSGSPEGFPSNMQPALAYGAEVGGVAGAQAWALLERRSVKPNYSTSPQFAIIPRR